MGSWRLKYVESGIVEHVQSGNGKYVRSVNGECVGFGNGEYVGSNSEEVWGLQVLTICLLHHNYKYFSVFDRNDSSSISSNPVALAVIQ